MYKICGHAHNSQNSNWQDKKVEENVLNNSKNLTGIVFLTQDYIDDVKEEYNIKMLT